MKTTAVVTIMDHITNTANAMPNATSTFTNLIYLLDIFGFHYYRSKLQLVYSAIPIMKNIVSLNY